MDSEALRTIRHDARSAANALRMCVAVLELPMPADERAGFVEEVIRSAETIGDLMAALEEMDDEPLGES